MISHEPNIIRNRKRFWKKSLNCPPTVITYHVALIYHFLGDREKTLLALEEAYEQRDLWLVWIGFEPPFDNLRSDTRFQRLLELTGLGGAPRLHTVRLESA